MQLDLNCLIEEIHIWKNIVKKKDTEIEDLRNQFKESTQHIETVDSLNSSLLLEISQQNAILSSLHQSLSTVEKIEANNKALVEESKKLKSNLNEQEKLHKDHINELKLVIEKLEFDCKKKVEQRAKETEAKVFSELEKCAINIDEKEKLILSLKNEISKIENEKEQEILRIKIECEEKLKRMISKVGKNKGIHQHDYKSNDFFRQKYMEKEKEAKEESMKLKREIDDLKREILSIKTNHIFTTQHKNSLPKEQTTSSDNITKLDEDKNAAKRTRVSCGSPGDDFILPTSVRRQSSSVTPFKKKLFNIDKNFFSK